MYRAGPCSRVEDYARAFRSCALLYDVQVRSRFGNMMCFASSCKKRAQWRSRTTVHSNDISLSRCRCANDTLTTSLDENKGTRSSPCSNGEPVVLISAAMHEQWLCQRARRADRLIASNPGSDNRLLTNRNKTTKSDLTTEALAFRSRTRALKYD